MEYHLHFQSAPKVNFAHRFEAAEYLPGDQCLGNGIIEITYILQGNVWIQAEGEEEETLVPADSVVVEMHDKRHVFYSTGYHEHATVGIEVSYGYTEEGGLVLPHYHIFENPDNPVRSLIDQLIVRYTTEPESPLVSALIYRILGEISYASLDHSTPDSFGSKWYTEKAKSYIIHHLEDPLEIGNISSFLRISPGYLSHMFRQTEGKTMIRFINEMRLKRIEELVLQYGMSIQDAGRKVGLNDPGYVGRLFRQIRGINISKLLHTRADLQGELWTPEMYRKNKTDKEN